MEVIFNNISKLELFWIACASYHLLKLLLSLATGSVDRTKDRPQPDEQELKFYQFRGKPTWYHLIGVVFTIILTYMVIGVSCMGHTPYDWTAELINCTLHTEKTQVVRTGIIRITIVCLLLTIYQLFRFYESMFVVMYSGRGVTNPISMILTIIFQIAQTLTVLAGGPSITDLNVNLECASYMDLLDITLLPLIFIFFISLFMHRHSHLQLAKLRKNKFGHATTTAYKKPSSEGIFSYVSSPHLFCELMVYVVFGLILGCGSCCWWVMTASVLFSLANRAYRSHKWYCVKFDDFPRDRKAIIPFLF